MKNKHFQENNVSMHFLKIDKKMKHLVKDYETMQQ